MLLTIARAPAFSASARGPSRPSGSSQELLWRRAALQGRPFLTRLPLPALPAASRGAGCETRIRPRRCRGRAGQARRQSSAVILWRGCLNFQNRACGGQAAALCEARFRRGRPSVPPQGRPREPGQIRTPPALPGFPKAGDAAWRAGP